MPSAPTARATRRNALNLRIKPEEQGLIDRAAALSGKTRTDFVLEAARRAAIETLTDRTLFGVDAASFAKFTKLLDTPPKPNEKLRRTMRTKPPWEP